MVMLMLMLELVLMMLMVLRVVRVVAVKRRQRLVTHCWRSQFWQLVSAGRVAAGGRMGATIVYVLVIIVAIVDWWLRGYW